MKQKLDRQPSEATGGQATAYRKRAWVGIAAGIQSPYAGLVAALLAALIVYLPSTTSWFWQDDVWYLPAVRHADALTFVRQAFDFRDTTMPVPAFLEHYRPLYLTGWLLRYRAFGEHAAAYHVMSIMVHLGNVALVWSIVGRLTRRNLTATVAAMVFAIHPAFTLSVVWASAATDGETLLASLAVFWFFIKYLDDGRGASAWYSASVAAYLVALLLHPKAIVAVVPLVLYYAITARPSLRDVRKPAVWGEFVPFFILGAGYAVVQSYVSAHGHQGELYALGWHNARNFLAYTAIAAMPRWRFIVDPAWVLYFPDALDPVPLFVGGVVLAALVVWCFMLDRRHSTMRRFAFLWFVGAVAPLTTFTPGAVDRDLYIAGPAWALLVGLAATWVWDALPRAAPARVCVAAVLVAALGLSARETWIYEHDITRRSLVWKSFTQELQRTYPVLAPGSTIYVTNAPLTLALFDDLDLAQLVHGFYPGVTARAISDSDPRRSHLGPNEYLFEYQSGQRVAGEP